jgi:serine/threonine protein kinase
MLRASKNKTKTIYKLGDFGLINHIIETTGNFSDLSEGDNKYLPPEVLQFEENPSNDKRLLLPKADIFSLGCSVYELVLIHMTRFCDSLNFMFKFIFSIC